MSTMYDDRTDFRAAVALQKSGRLEDAIKGYRRVMLARPGLLDVLWNFAIAWSSSGRVENTIRWYRRVHLLEPTFVPGLVRRARFALAAGDARSAVETLRRALVLDPAYAELYWMLCRAARESGDLPLACRWGWRALAVSPNRHIAYLDLRRALHEAGARDDLARLVVIGAGRFGDSDQDYVGFLTLGEAADPFEFVQDHAIVTERAHVDFARARLFPRRVSDFQDLDSLIERHIGAPGDPSAPPFAADARLLTLGSCFAAHLRQHLARQGRASDVINMPENLNNTFALRQFIEWSLTGDRASDAYWYDGDQGRGISRWMPAEEQDHYRRTFLETDGYVITIGLAEVWRDRATGGVFWRGVPKNLFHPSRHSCELSSVAENVANLARVIELIRAHCGERPIVFTLSPVPIQLTMVGRSCIEADCVSKSILRVALDELMSRRIPGVHYWPSFEIVRWVGAHRAAASFGEDGDPAHPSPPVVAAVIRHFIRRFFAAAG